MYYKEIISYNIVSKVYTFPMKNSLNNLAYKFNISSIALSKIFTMKYINNH